MSKINERMSENDLEPKQKTLWLKAVSAMEMRNLDFSITLLQQLLENEPRFLEGRKFLRKVEGARKKSEKTTKILGMTFGGKSGGGGGGLSGMMSSNSQGKKDPVAVMMDIEKILEKDPYNMVANRQLYDAAMRAGFVETASFALETVREGHPDNTQNLHFLAEHYIKQDDPEKAIDVYNQIKRYDPTDMDAATGEKNASARATMKKGGWEGGNFRGSLKNADQAQTLENESRAAMTPEQMEQRLTELSAQYEADPNNLDVVRKIADIYEKLDRHEESASYMEWALQLNPGDVALQRKIEIKREKVEDMSIKRMEAEISADPDSPESQEKQAYLDDYKRQRSAKLVEDAKVRVNGNPTDKQLRFELGQHLLNGGNYREAIPQFQQSKSNPHLRIKSMMFLGMCFEKLNMNDLARDQLADASKELVSFDNTKKEVLYNLGMVNLKIGDKTNYLECMKEIYNQDYSFRDVAARVEASYGDS